MIESSDNKQFSSASNQQDNGRQACDSHYTSGNGPATFSIGRRGILVILTLAILAAMTALDSTSIAVALPIISSDLDGTAIEAFWAGTSFLVCSTIFQPSFASLSNVFGRQSLLLIAITFFLVGAIVAGVAQNFTHMLVGRSIQGVGGGGILSLCEIVITDLVPLRFRGHYFGVLAAMWSLGSVLGPILGGGFSQSVTWRWIFYINFPFAGVGIVFVLLFLRFQMPRDTLLRKLRQIDYIGTAVFITSLSAFLIPLTWGGVLFTWDSWHTLVPLIIGAVGMLLFAYYECRVPSNPMIPPSIFHNRTAIVSFIGTIIHGLILWCLLYYLPLYYEAVKGYSPILSGVAFFPESFTVAPSALVTGVIITYSGNYRWLVWCGWVFSTLGAGLLCLMEVQTSVPAWIFLNIVPGLGLGILFTASSFAIQASSTAENMAISIAMFSFFRALGQTFGVAIGGVIFQNCMKDNMLKYPSLASHAAEYSQDSTAVVHIIKTTSNYVVASQLKEAYTNSLRAVWATCCGLSGVGLLLSLFTEEYSLDQAQSNQTF